MAKLSNQARQKRYNDMQEVAEQKDGFGYLALILVGVLLLIESYMAKLSKDQRAALVFVTLAAGGTAIGILLYKQFVGLALVLVFVLGIAVAEIRRL